MGKGFGIMARNAFWSMVPADQRVSSKPDSHQHSKDEPKSRDDVIVRGLAFRLGALSLRMDLFSKVPAQCAP